ncbi:MAG: ATPase, partial [Spirochaetia bacterium]|nr:ATPase [Spirochaetia bacterium]
ILELLSEGRTSRSEIESILEKNIGGYLEKLLIDYDIVGKIKPIGSKPTGRIQKYFIKDNFLRFWFRFVYKYRSAIENNNFAYIKKKLIDNLRTYSGPILEKLYHEIYRYSGRYSEIGNYWEKGNENEIDLICIDELKKEMLLGEVKMNKQKIDMNALKNKSKNLIKNFNGYNLEYVGLGLQDIDDVLEKESL